MEKKEETRGPNRYWIGVFGASALALAIVFGVVMQVRSSKPQTAAQTQARARTQAAVRTQAVVKTPTAAVKPQAAVKAQAAVKPPAAVKPDAGVKPLTDAERKTSEALWVEQKKLETDITRVATTPDGRGRVSATIAKQFSVSDKVVSDLRGRKLAYGEMTVALALSQQLMKREKATQQKALDRIVELRKSGQGWGAIARALGLKLGDVIDQVQKVDRQVAKLDTGKSKG